ncbi:DUF6894 family protein [Methylobacterium nigriterrae]|uniref:DUF6894 family protein n=1 Tax=Methylobacterium nigriterrae TaxID=3127512 RepID=UPI003013CC54
MALYFFDFHDHENSFADEEAAEFADIKAVSEEALRALCEIVADQPQRYADQMPRMTVRDSTGKAVLAVTLTASTTWLGGEQPTSIAA